MKSNNALSLENVAKLPLFKTGDGPAPHVTLFKTYNHVFKIETKSNIYYLKTHTKDWYAKDPKLVGHLPSRESFAWQLMRVYGLSTPIVVVIDSTCENAIERPYLVTEQLTGDPLTNLIEKVSKKGSHRIIRSVGAYLRKMHSITFKSSGILTPQGPVIDGDWHHRMWTYHGFRTWADREQEDARKALLPETYGALIGYMGKWEPTLKDVYEHPVFVHGDCHAHQFYLSFRDKEWNVSGVLDMEVASAGDCGEDFIKFCAEMSRRYVSETEWWQPLFEGYEEEPNFDLIKLRYLASSHIELSPFAYQDLPGVRELVVQHVLGARSWKELFDLSQIKKTQNNAMSL
jgi:aminoglycoside phosphotransferase (APT) family kinase protein